MGLCGDGRYQGVGGGYSFSFRDQQTGIESWEYVILCHFSVILAWKRYSILTSAVAIEL